MPQLLAEPDRAVILGGLLTSTFLFLVLVPVLFAGKKQEDRPKGAEGQPEQALHRSP